MRQGITITLMMWRLRRLELRDACYDREDELNRLKVFRNIFVNGVSLFDTSYRIMVSDIIQRGIQNGYRDINSQI